MSLPAPNAPGVFSLAGFRRGALATGPLLIGMAPFGLVCGVAAQGAGLSWLEAGIMSATIYAGTAQLLALASWTHPAPILLAALAAAIVNLRFLLMGAVLTPWLDRVRGWRLWGTLFVMVDQNWAMSVQEMNAGRRDVAFLLGSGVAMWGMWVLSTLAGFALGQALHPDHGHPLYFAAVAVFVAMLVTMWRGKSDLLPWLVAAATALVVVRLLPGTPWYIVAGAITGSLTGGVREYRRS